MYDLVRLPQALQKTNRDERPNWKKAAIPAGAALLLVALGWGAGAKIDSLRGPSPEQIAAQAAADNAEKAKKEVAALRVHVDGLKGKLEAQVEKARESDAAVAALQKSLAEEKAQSRTLHAQVEKLATPPAKETKPAPQQQAQAAPQALPQTLQHALPQPPARLIDRAPTASIGKPLPKPMASPVSLKPQASAPKPYRGYVLRDVNEGLAVVEGEDGVEEIGPGDVLAGGARVQRIERRGGGWVVMTDRGFIAADGRWAE
ncbi:hypothetical protein CCR94_20170 [Rhodoblastus sphagnicola]|uniref:Uncharacterized protein n=1 Tax=Rhodoblastus sphagnicola TaxID=333368 RepID=A0A2S6MYF7_9HYPH|nr:hypothetical protein [Rhodoblastus sphagnicola]MBB4199417.1 hypothetical protein [Rhodoblastus sphagnicola]PPQ27391.1 hypothetical protein CCR94_20170 [Rhodoblastus sphagnicola]